MNYESSSDEVYAPYGRKSKPEKREPRTSPETIELIKQMARENWLWGSEIRWQGGNNSPKIIPNLMDKQYSQHNPFSGCPSL